MAFRISIEVNNPNKTSHCLYAWWVYSNALIWKSYSIHSDIFKSCLLVFNEGTTHQLIWKTELVKPGSKLRGRTFLVSVVMTGMFIEELSQYDLILRWYSYKLTDFWTSAWRPFRCKIWIKMSYGLEINFQNVIFVQLREYVITVWTLEFTVLKWW